MTWLSKIPVGSARASRSNDSSSPARSRLVRICHTTPASSGGRDTARRRYSRSAGRRRIDGSNGASCSSLSMNIRLISSGVMPFASPAAMKPPELTPT